MVQAALDRLLAKPTLGNSQPVSSVLDRPRTTIVIAHRLSTIKNADRIVVLSNLDGSGGNVIEQGTHDELLRLPQGNYKAMWEMTTGKKA